MTNLHPKIFTEFSEVLNIANHTLDRNQLGHEILDILFRCFNIEQGGFKISGEDTESQVVISKNTGERWIEGYRTYFHKDSPFRQLHGKASKQQIITLEEVIEPQTFFSSEFYNDFFKPQKIRYKIMIKLEAKGKSIGEICLCRSSDSRNFSGHEIALLRTMSDHVSSALEHNNLLRKIKFNDNLFKIIENQWEKGLIVLDDNMKLLFMNRKGKEFCRMVVGNHPIPPVLLEGFHSIKKDLKEGVPEHLVLQRHMAINFNSNKLSVYTQIIDKDVSPVGTRSFMITIEESNYSDGIDKKRLKTLFHLTGREIDIVMYVFKGLKNMEIAQELFISEMTIKKHIQNIFEKVGVKNRTALINRALNQDQYPFH